LPLSFPTQTFSRYAGLPERHGLSKDHFYLVGLLDDGNPEYGWKSFELKDPFIALTKLGKFEIETRLQVDPTVIFGIERNQQ